MHERFSEIIAFPPMPVALDFEVWMQASGMLFELEKDPQPKKEFADDWSEKYESLVEQTEIDGIEYLELSPTGLIFHETFRERFRSNRDAILPPPALQKLEPVLHDHGVISKHCDQLLRYLGDLTKQTPFVTRCVTTNCNPDLPRPNRFRADGDGIEGIFSDGSQTVKFRVETTAKTSGQTTAAIAALNEWLAQR